MKNTILNVFSVKLNLIKCLIWMKSHVTNPVINYKNFGERSCKITKIFEHFLKFWLARFMSQNRVLREFLNPFKMVSQQGLCPARSCPAMSYFIGDRMYLIYTDSSLVKQSSWNFMGREEKFNRFSANARYSPGPLLSYGYFISSM